MDLQHFNAKRCLTVVGCLVENGKILLIHHTMLDMWMSPGGHVEENELPHKAAEREFYEETGINVKTVTASPMPAEKGEISQFLPTPAYSNLHWINTPEENKRSPNTGKRCEQHYVFAYYVKRIGKKQDATKDKGIKNMRWFGKEELDALNMSNDLRTEAKFVLEHYPT